MSEHDKQCAANLKRIWNDRRRELGLTQEQVAKRAGWSAAASFGAYLHGRIPMNLNAKLLLAEILQIDVHEIDPEFPEYALISAEKLDDDEKQLLADYGQLSVELKQAVRAQVRALTGLQNNHASH